MAFYDRGYMRDDWSPRRYGPARSGRGFADWEVWKKLIAINIAVFLLQIIITRPATEDDLRRLPYFDPYMYTEYDEELYSEYERDLADAESDTKHEAESDEDRLATDSEPDGSQGEGSDTGAEHAKQSDKNESEKSRRERKIREMRERAQEQLRENMFRYMPRVSILQEYWELDSEKIKQGQLWRLITAGFCHDRTGVWHLLFNMLFLYWFGKRLERVYGSAEFTAFYFAALLTSSLSYIALDLYTNKGIPAIGASGAVWGVVALYALLYPYERIYIYFLFPVEIRWLVLLYFILDLHPVLLALSGENQFTGVAHAAHIGGAIFGFVYWNQGWQLMPVVNHLKSSLPTLHSASRSYDASPEVIKMPSKNDRADSTNSSADRMDEILAKITRQGRESLTDEELEFLEETSRQIRKDRRESS
ncbi:MAG: rhomboid family intramembrane serine protease [Planctomycetaceae bacterium]|nr:rhomboid family intramembrane serine protease [Planctomycetales bacterium]MCB9925766.1 rhomboid family intramembrane serine protease [Planctomycetaceae bacterium]